MFEDGVLQGDDLFGEEGLLRGLRQGNPLESGMGDNHRIPIAGGNSTHQGLPPFLFKIFLGCHQNVGGGIEGQKFRRELLQHVIRHDEQRLAGESQPLQLHGRRYESIGFSGPYDMCQKGVGRLKNAPDRGLLMRSQGDGVAGSGQLKMVAIEGPQTNAIETVVIQSAKSFPTGLVLPDPGLKAFLDFLLFVACRFRCRSIDHLFVLNRIGIVDGGRPQVQGILDEIERRASVCSPLGGIGHRDAHIPFAFDGPGTNQVRMTDLDPAFTQQGFGKGLDIVAGKPGTSQSGIDFKVEQVFWLHLPERLDIELVLRVDQCRRLGDAELFPDGSGEVIIVGLPVAGLGIVENQALELGQNLGFRESKKGCQKRDIHPTAFGQCDQQGRLGILDIAGNGSRGNGPLSEDGGFGRSARLTVVQFDR